MKKLRGELAQVWRKEDGGESGRRGQIGEGNDANKGSSTDCSGGVRTVLSLKSLARGKH